MNNLFTDKTSWCWHPDIKPKVPCFVFFRKTFDVKESSCRLKLNVSADNRYNLYLDGRIIGRGPCRSDLEHYIYEDYDLEIEQGRHTLAAHVIVYGTGCRGKEVAVAEMHTGSGFVVAGGIFKNGRKLFNLETPESWKCDEDKARSHRPLDAENDLKTYTAIPPMEEMDFSNLPRKWMSSSFNDSLWKKPSSSGPVTFRGTMKDPYSQWWLIPRQIPMMEEKDGNFKSVVRTESVDALSAVAWINGRSPLKIDSRARIVIDAGSLTTAFPCFEFVGGSHATVKITYSESLFVKGKKLERDHKDGIVFGYSDLLKLDGGVSRFEPFWFRTFRFVELEVVAHLSSPVLINPPSFRTFMYPLEMKAGFDTGDGDIRRIWDIAWRTARLCAHEHYYDCPYYEQLQYTGDTRIQALISYASTGDGRLGRQSILQYDWSRLPEGITQSRYPSAWKQVIVGFSLYWIMMIRDYYEYFGDKELVKEVFPGIKAVLEWFERHKLENGLIGHLVFWNFTDWLPEWPHGNPSRDTRNPITINTMQYAEACRTAAYLAEEIGDKSGLEYTARYRNAVKAINKLCFDRKLGLYVDMPGTKYISQHTNSWAILCDAVTGKKAESLGREIYKNGKLSKATLYFAFYLFRAWEKVGCYELFWKQLENWKSVLKWNFTTFPEIPYEHTRSDCHAWSASPIYEFISCVLGIRPGSPGFKSILIQPHPSKYGRISGTAPAGGENIDVSLEISKGKEMIIGYAMKTARPVTIIWPDGRKLDVRKKKEGTFKRKI